MYEVKFLNEGKDLASLPLDSVVYVEDLERALAFASMLGKISTPQVGFTDIKVSPTKLNDNE